MVGPSARSFCIAMLSLGATMVSPGIAMGQEPVGQTQEPLITLRPPVDPNTRLQFGLLTLTTPEGTCSASMLNSFWAITAAHCVFSNKGACPPFAPNQISLTANWPGITPSGTPKTAQAKRITPFGTPTQCAPPQNMQGFPNDIALIQLGRHDFDRANFPAMKLNEQRPMGNLTVTAYGRGINALAFQIGPTAVPSVSDGQYRSAEFDISSISPNSALPPATFSFPGKKGAIIAGGDSGGPSYIQDWDNPLSTQRKLEWRLLGVHSSCSTNCLAGQTCAGATTWTWVASINQCTDAAIFPLRTQIVAAIEDIPADDSPTGTFPNTTPPSVLAHQRALYALNIDEPLIGPPGAVQDVGLTFQKCHTLRIGEDGCPVVPFFEQWGYDVTTHHLLHTPSGKCVNISGARRDASAPIILFPCSSGTNDKWTLIERAGSFVWSIKSDFDGLCLEAIPGRAGGSDGLRVFLPTAATLAQRPCNGSDAQKFSNVDADWARRNGPH